MLPSPDSRARYRALCREAPVQLFAQDWWLDAVAGGNWDVVLAERGGEVHAALPYVSGRRLGMPVARMPQMTRSLGPWFRDVGGTEAARIGREEELTGELLAQLPALAQFRQNFSPAVTNGLPWYWRGYVLETRYTYVVDPGRSEEVLWDGLSHATRKNVRKARDRHGLRVEASEDFDAFLALHRMVFARQGKSAPVADTLLRRIDAAAADRGQRRITVARDPDGRIHAAAYIVRDANAAYYLMSGSDPELRQSGALALLLWEAVRDASAAGLVFDFEGSMIPAIEHFFRGFGARQTPYHFVWRTDSRLLATLDLLRAWRAGKR